MDFLELASVSPVPSHLSPKSKRKIPNWKVVGGGELPLAKQIDSLNTVGFFNF